MLFRSLLTVLLCSASLSLKEISLEREQRALLLNTMHAHMHAPTNDHLKCSAQGEVKEVSGRTARPLFMLWCPVLLEVEAPS